MQPTTCPFCRRAFLPERAKKLHVDRPSPLLEHDDYQRVKSFLQLLAVVPTEDSDEQEAQVARTINDVNQWLATREDDRHEVVSCPCC